MSSLLPKLGLCRRQSWLSKTNRGVVAGIVWMLLFQPIGLGPVCGQEKSKPSEYQVKAVYLYNFSRFVEWPSQAPALKTNSFEICVLGRDPFGPALDTTVAGENVDGKSVVARRISKPEEGLDCRVLFVSASEDSHLKSDLTVFEKAGVLTVSDMPHFSQRGGMIQFVTDGGKVRFEVNLSNANDSGLSLSSDLLKLAVAVRKNS